MVKPTPLKRKRKPAPLGRLILDRLDALGKSRKWLAEEMGNDEPLSQAALSKWILEGTIHRDKVPLLAKVLQVSIADVHGAEEVSEDAAVLHRAYQSCDEEDRAIIRNILKRYVPQAEWRHLK